MAITSLNTLEFVPHSQLLCEGTQLFLHDTKMSYGQDNLLVSVLQTDGHREVWSGKLLNACGFDLLEKRKM